MTDRITYILSLIYNTGIYIYLYTYISLVNIYIRIQNWKEEMIVENRSRQQFFTLSSLCIPIRCFYFIFLIYFNQNFIQYTFCKSTFIFVEKKYCIVMFVVTDITIIHHNFSFDIKVSIYMYVYYLLIVHIPFRKYVIAMRNFSPLF